jgi:hypothetical protein
MFGKSFRYATVFSVDQPSILPFPRVAVQKQEPVDSAAMATARVLPCPKAAGRHMESDCFFRLQIGTAYRMHAGLHLEIIGRRVAMTIYDIQNIPRRHTKTRANSLFDKHY